MAENECPRLRGAGAEGKCAKMRANDPEDSLMPDPNQPRQRWDSRLVRLSQLAEVHQPIAPALRFYRTILEFQAEVSSRCRGLIEQDIPLRAQIEVSALTGEMPSLFGLVDRHGPELLRQAAHQWELS